MLNTTTYSEANPTENGHGKIWTDHKTVLSDGIMMGNVNAKNVGVFTLYANMLEIIAAVVMYT
jgi:hypothetical protein